MTLELLAKKISAYLRLWEADPEINANETHGDMRLKTYFHAGACRAGRYVQVCYVSYQGHTSMTKAQAEEYLAWIEAGNVGSHFMMSHRKGREAK